MRRRRTRGAGHEAGRADKYLLYQLAVQDPVGECRFLSTVYKRAFGRPARTLREDFCGTGAVSCAWVASGRERVARGYDLDPEPLAWGEEHNVGSLAPDAQERVSLTRGDVLLADGPAADIICAENFSYFVFHTRAELRRYLERAKGHLREEGLLVLDVMGGPEMLTEGIQETRECGDFRYVWEVGGFDPLHSRGTYRIHFRFGDGSELRRAFSYDWRVWTIPELRDLLLEVGFRRVDVYWEDAGRDGNGTGRYRLRQRVPGELAWVAYIVGVKQAERTFSELAVQRSPGP